MPKPTGRDDGGALFALVEENAVRIYDPAWPQTPLAVYDSANLPLYGYDAVYVGGIYYDDRGGDLLALMYYPYDSGFTSNVEEGRYEVTDYLWRVAVLDKYSPGTPVRVLTMQQHPACNSQTTYPQGEVLLREGLLYYSNYYNEAGLHTLPNGETLWERWCFNLTSGASQRIETNEPGAVSDGAVSAMFRIGPEGELKEIADGGKIGSWFVSELTVIDENWAEATFLSNLELECTVSLDRMAGERAYIFSVNEEGVAKMPFFEGDNRTGVWFQPVTNEGLEALDDLAPGDERICRVTVYEYRYSYVPMAAYSSAAISEIEVL